MFWQKFSWMLLICSLMVLPASATITHAVDLDGMIKASNLIVLGELVTMNRGVGTSVVDVTGSPVNVKMNRGVLRIDELMVGTNISPFTVDFPVPIQNLGWLTPVQQSYGVFFFKVGTDGKILITDPVYSYFEVPRGVHSHGDTAMERVVSILSQMLTFPNSSQSVGIPAIRYLQSSKSQAARLALSASLDTVADPQLTVNIANGLLLQGDASSLKFIKRAFLTGPRISMDSFQEEVLGNAMATYLKDPQAIPDLEELLGSSSVYIRRGAAGALRGAVSSNAIRGLARAIEDTDSQVRYWGVVGLAEVTGQKDWRPNDRLFKSDESRFLSYWKEWAQKRLQ